MNNMNIFLAAPMSSLESEAEYTTFRNSILSFSSFLRSKGFTVFSEIEAISSQSSYDSPADSARKDFDAIKKSDIFILVHQKKVQTSALMELGYALALGKTIVIIYKENTLPYLALGLPEMASNVSLIKLNEWNEKLFSNVADLLS